MKFNKWTYLFFIIVNLINCNKAKKTIDSEANCKNFGNVIVDPKISNNIIYKELDKQVEIFNFYEDLDSTIKKSSAVSYSRNFNNKSYNFHNNCRTFLFKSDTIIIDIGLSNGFTGMGFYIYLKNKKFNIYNYGYTDASQIGATKKRQEIIYQNLILDKQHYQIGDNIYGKVDFKSIETDNESNTNEYFGKGSFRTVVKRPLAE